ncbi:hypothetical protein RZS08_49555, partial [Arthrospira platensis SPKY1]|nr:hypothetical protein [Arthrospira platensis SPKY1]
LFRDQRAQLDEAPHPRTWRRLEQRLEAQRQRRRLPRYRILGMAAGLFFLAVLAGLLAIFAEGRVGAGQAAAPLALEQLSQTDANPLDLQAVKTAQLAQEQLRQPVVEGQAGQRLVP